MRKILEIIGNIITIFIIGIVLAKLRIKVKNIYFIVLGALSICIGVGFGTISLAVLGFDDVGGNLYNVLIDYSLIFSICSIFSILLLDRVVISIEESILESSRSIKIKYFQVLYSFLSGAGLLTYFFIVPEIIATITFWIIFIGSIIYGLKSKVKNL